MEFVATALTTPVLGKDEYTNIASGFKENEDRTNTNSASDAWCLDGITYPGVRGASFNRGIAVDQQYSRPGSLYGKLACCNITTLFKYDFEDATQAWKDTARDKIVEVAKKRFNINYMHMVVITDKTVEDAKAILEPTWGKLPTSDTVQIVDAEGPHPAGTEYVGNIIRYATERHRTDGMDSAKLLTLQWYHKRDLAQDSALKYVQKLLEKTNTNWQSSASLLEVGGMSVMRETELNHVRWTITYSLTSNSWFRIDKIVELFFTNIKLLLDQSINDHEWEK